MAEQFPPSFEIIVVKHPCLFVAGFEIGNQKMSAIHVHLNGQCDMEREIKENPWFTEKNVREKGLVMHECIPFDC